MQHALLHATDWNWQQHEQEADEKPHLIGLEALLAISPLGLCLL